MSSHSVILQHLILRKMQAPFTLSALLRDKLIHGLSNILQTTLQVLNLASLLPLVFLFLFQILLTVLDFLRNSSNFFF